MPTNPKPQGWHTVTPCIICDNAREVITFLRDGLGGTVKEVIDGPDGGVMHSEVLVGDSMVMVGSASAKYPPMPAMLYLYVDDVDAAHARAVEAGGVSYQEPADQLYGDRTAGVTDPGGNKWHLAVHVEDVSNEEIARRYEELGTQGADGAEMPEVG
jgi:uncharacterized glyoxalase superfamily protein PhnB